MATPVGHALVAILAGRLSEAENTPLKLWLSLSIFATVAPDLDFLPGLFAGDINRFHHGASHSLGAAVVFGALVALFVRARLGSRLRVAAVAAVLYSSHLLLDFMTVDTRPPIGQPLLWPLTMHHFAMDRPVLLGVRHGSVHGDLASFVLDALSRHNLWAALREIVIIAPPVTLVWIILGGRAGSRARLAAAAQGD